MTDSWFTLVGIAAAYFAPRGWGIASQVMRVASFSFWPQLAHGVEHIALSSSYFAFGT